MHTRNKGYAHKMKESLSEEEEKRNKVSYSRGITQEKDINANNGSISLNSFFSFTLYDK